MRRLSFLLIVAVYSFQAHANEELDWKAFNKLIAERHIVAGYNALAYQATTLHQESKVFCSALDNTSLTKTKEVFHRTMDAWQSIQHVQFGPIEYANRSASLQFWPDKKNHIGKQLKRLLTQKNANSLSEGFNKLGVATKGLPAIERLLFTDSIDVFYQDTYRCSLLMRITHNVEQISLQLKNEWQTQMLAQFLDASQIDGYFEDDIDAATALLKSMIEPIEIIRDLKIKRPLGSEIKYAKYKRLESWRTKRSLKNIQLNLAAIEEMTFILSKVVRNEDMKIIAMHFKNIYQTITSIDEPLEESIMTESGYAAAHTLANQLTKLHTYLEQLTNTLGINLGFNSRDGD